MRNDKKCNILKLLLLVCLLNLGACGDDDGDSTNVTIQDPGEEQREQGPGGTPGAAGRPIVINNLIDNDIKVTNRTRIEDNETTTVIVDETTINDDDDLILEWSCEEVAPVVHHQYIHLGTRCPTIADDTNGDQVVDQSEAEQVVGVRVLALDNNLASETAEQFPSGTSFSYNQTISLFELEQFGITQGQNFVVMIYGVEEGTPLPATYTTTTDGPVHLTVPISCSIIKSPTIISVGPANEETPDGTTGGTTDETGDLTSEETTDEIPENVSEGDVEEIVP